MKKSCHALVRKKKWKWDSRLRGKNLVLATKHHLNSEYDINNGGRKIGGFSGGRE